MRDKNQGKNRQNTKRKSYQGELVVLIDSDSASASEVFARVIQLEGPRKNRRRCQRGRGDDQQFHYNGKCARRAGF